MHDIILYSTGCPMCRVLKAKLAAKQIGYTEVNDVDKMLALGIETVPVLSVNGELMMFKEAADWVNKQ